jgi:hypothetical protein
VPHTDRAARHGGTHLRVGRRTTKPAVTRAPADPDSRSPCMRKPGAAAVAGIGWCPPTRPCDSVAQVDHETQVVMPVRRSPALSVRGGDVVRGALVVASGVLGGHRGERRAGQVGHGGGAGSGLHLGVPGHGQILVDDQPPAIGRATQLVDERVRAYPGAPDQRARCDELTIAQQDALAGRLPHRHARRYVHPPHGHAGPRPPRATPAGRARAGSGRPRPAAATGAGRHPGLQKSA